MRRNIAMCIEYDGSSYYGWQRQPGFPTVQGTIESMLGSFFNREILIDGSGRTDAGVHAYGQVASFSVDTSMPAENMERAFNNILCKELGRGAGSAAPRMHTAPIRIKWVRDVPCDFHARFSAVGKKYIYRLRMGGEPSAFDRNYIYHVRGDCDVDAMQKAAGAFIGEHDFSAFMASGAKPMESYVREIFSIDFGLPCRVDSEDPGDSRAPFELEIGFSGSGFLYNMVRIMIGTLVDVGCGKIAAEAVPSIIASKKRENAGHTAPPQGLYLAEVYYDWAL